MEKAEQLSEEDIMAIFNQLRQLLEGGDGPTRALVKAQAKEIKRLKSVIADHAFIMGILWRHYAE
ncbi:hypothetical protein PIB30_035605 [Stylosanthes scabra]|uniref:Uncharacterized protein n=1 Tax=Stylosanthes scabra TaxID=79078 RepID=A0ABU6XB72_9FABA|nr:hypothetical protein [Stylosanthes scabra]